MKGLLGEDISPVHSQRRFKYLETRQRPDHPVSVRLICGEVRKALMILPKESVHCVVTSPPYYGLRDYKTEPQVWGDDLLCKHEYKSGKNIKQYPQKLGKRRDTWWNSGIEIQSNQGLLCVHCGAYCGQLGLEPTPELYIEHLVEVFREVRRVLRDDGLLFLNIGDSYDSNKNLIGIPWMLAFALRADGWYLRSEITWIKVAAIPESIRDRPTSATEKIFLLSKSPRYFWDYEGGREKRIGHNDGKITGRGLPGTYQEHRNDRNSSGGFPSQETKRNMRNWWALAPDPFSEGHFAVFPQELPARAIAVATSERGCCLNCRSPWERVKADCDIKNERAINAINSGRIDGYTLPGTKAFDITKTIGWKPTCDCTDTGNTIPCTVLDPFSGAGTTALVASQMGCNAVGIDLSQEYTTMAKQKIEKDTALLGYSTVSIENV